MHVQQNIDKLVDKQTKMYLRYIHTTIIMYIKKRLEYVDTISRQYSRGYGEKLLCTNNPTAYSDPQQSLADIQQPERTTGKQSEG